MATKEKYLAFRIDTSTIKNHEVVHGFFIRGQRSTDYNWPLIAEADDMEQAVEIVRGLRTDPNRQPVYNNGGYGIKI